MDIRRAGVDDANAVAHLVAEFFAADGFDPDPDVVAERVGMFLTEPQVAAFLAVSSTGKAAGLATITTTYGLEHGWLAEIEDLYVRPAFRSGRVGRALVEAAMGWATTERGVTTFEVVVTPEGSMPRDSLLDWYSSLGFEDTGRRILQRSGEVRR